LNFALNSLSEIERSSCILDVKSAEPKYVEDQFHFCLKMYRNLSEIKSEIESVIKTGRKLCEDKDTTKNPKKMGQRIDNLKNLYNTLGDNVTRSKKDLETLLKFVEKLNSNFELIEQGLKLYEQRRNANSSEVESNDCNEMPPLDTIKVALDDCVHIYDDYEKICEPNYLVDLKKTIDKFQDRYFILSDAEINKILNDMKSTLQNSDKVPVETLR
jgi:septation ring formation regulator EzrA